MAEQGTQCAWLYEKPKMDYREPFEFKDARIARGQNPFATKSDEMASMVRELQKNKFGNSFLAEWWQNSRLNPVNTGRPASEMLQQVPNGLCNFAKSKVGPNAYNVSGNIAWHDVSNTYVYGPTEGMPSDVELGLRLMDDYMCDVAEQDYDRLRQAMPCKQALLKTFQQNGWNKTEYVAPSDPSTRITITPCRGYDVEQIKDESDIEFYMMECNKMTMYGEYTLLNVANKCVNIEEYLAEDAESKKKLQDFFEEHLADHTKEEWVLSLQVSEQGQKAWSDAGYPGFYSEYMESIVPELAVDFGVAEAAIKDAIQLREDAGKYSEWYKDLYDHSPSLEIDDVAVEKRSKPKFSIIPPTAKGKAPYVTGEYMGDNGPDVVFFKQTYGTHTFTNDEIESLLRGDKIAMDFRSGPGEVQLGPCSVNGRSYFGVKRVDAFLTRKTPEVNEIQQQVESEQKSFVSYTDDDELPF